MNLRVIGTRLRLAVLAAAGGWLAAFAVTLPMQLLGIYHRADGDLRGMGTSLLMGALVWAVWSLALAGAILCCGGLPVLLIVRERWLFSHRRRAVALAALGGWAAVLVQFQIWRIVVPDHLLDYWLFSLYSLLFVIFTAVTATLYLRLVTRIRPA
jgi:hypothetical protein